MYVKYCNHLCGVKEIHLVRLAKTLILSKNLFTVPKTETMETRYPTVVKTTISALFITGLLLLNLVSSFISGHPYGRLRSTLGYL